MTKTYKWASMNQPSLVSRPLGPDHLFLKGKLAQVHIDAVSRATASHIHIDGLGGSASLEREMCRLLRQQRVATYVEREAISAGAAIFAAGTLRFTKPGAQFLFHLSDDYRHRQKREGMDFFDIEYLKELKSILPPVQVWPLINGQEIVLTGSHLKGVTFIFL
jgi:hypothetical protein